jgi:hypothetical protein
MSDGTETEIPMTDASDAVGDSADSATDTNGGTKEQTFTQADVDRIVKERVARTAAKYADYDDLKSKAEGARTLEERLAAVEGELTTTKAEALRTRIASEFGVSTKPGANGEPSDADLFLTGTDEASLIAQAQRLAAREADRKQHGNVARNEGDSKQTGENGDTSSFVTELFSSSAD